MTVDILVIGGAHIDRRGHIFGQTKMGASNPGRWMEEPGGGGFNAACNLARLGHSVRLISPRGGDAAGEQVAAAAERLGIDDCPVVFLDRATPSYTAILEDDGNLVIALADMALYDLFSARRLRARTTRESLASTRTILCDANLPAETLTALGNFAASNGVPLSAIAISPAKATKLIPGLHNLDHVFMNANEAEVLAGRRAEEPAEWPLLLRKAGLKAGTITAGGSMTIAFDGDEVMALSPPPVSDIADVTGAGDAFASGFLSARLGGGTLDLALRMGTAAAALTLRSPRATAESLSPDLLDTHLALVPEPEILS
ncbi:MAG: carbohydrate kinase [Shinella sp.]|nr:MAG: carbohydrate kinase [Shinella sp.]